MGCAGCSHVSLLPCLPPCLPRHAMDCRAPVCMARTAACAVFRLTISITGDTHPFTQAYAQQQPGYQQQWPGGYSASGYYQQGYGQQGYPGHPPPPPQQPPPPGAAGGYAGARPGSGYARPQAAQQPAANGSQQPAWKAAADRVAAAAAGSGSWAAPAHQKHQAQQAQQAQQQAQHAQQTYSPDTYNAVPPPAAIAGMTVAAAAAYGGGGRRTFSIRPQAPKPKQPEQANPLVAAFNQAASKLTGGAAAAAAPAYTRVQVSPAAPQGLLPQQQQQAAAAAVPPQQWPPALKAYVERAFTTTDTVSARALIVWFG